MPDVFKKLLVILAAAGLFASAGCASHPKAGLRTFFISGAPYVGLDQFCSQKGIRSEYDGLTRTVALAKNYSSARFLVGGMDVLLNNRLERLEYPASYHKGMVVIPEELRRKFEELFPERLDGTRVFSCLKKVVIDPGHGGKDPGAVGASGLQEKEVVLDISRKLKRELEREGIEVVMTRSTDVFVPLDERAEIANRADADLFLSIHANANRSRSLKGFEVYYISPSVSDSKRALSTAKSGRFRLGNSCFLSPSQNLKAIIWDLTYDYDRREAIELSRMLCKSMRSNPDTRVIGVKNANFAVLRGSTVPAVLVEVGFISNLSEEALIRTGSYRQKLAERLKEGIRLYCEGLAQIRGCPGERPTTLVKDGT